jgi:hypothetical protein|tara:strand:+ start:1130 stop:1333 length:204 start_codon:yes stop_codon:yes gene_type:complete
MVKKIGPLEKRPGMLQVTKNMLFTYQDIENACIELGYDNHKMFDKLTGFPNTKNKCVGVLQDDEVKS